MIDGLRKIILIGLSFGVFGMISKNVYAAETPDPIIEKILSLSDNYKSEGQKDEEVNGSGKLEFIGAKNLKDSLPISFFEMLTSPSCWSTSTKICVAVGTGVVIGALITYFYMNSKNDRMDTKPPYDPDAAVIKLHQIELAKTYFQKQSDSWYD